MVWCRAPRTIQQLYLAQFLQRLDLRLDNTHPIFINVPRAANLKQLNIYNIAILTRLRLRPTRCISTAVAA